MQCAGLQLHDRLIGDTVEVAQAEEVVERLVLDRLGGLGHADPVGEAGGLDGRRERHQVAIRLGQVCVHRDDPVAGLIRIEGDVGGERLGEQDRRRDEDRPRVQFEDACILQLGGEPADEAGVARPEQALIGWATGRREQSHGGILGSAPGRYAPPRVPGPWVRWSGPVWSGTFVRVHLCRYPGATCVPVGPAARR